MTYQNDPHNRRPAEADTSYIGWIVGGVVAVAVIVGIFMMTNRSATNTATNDTTVPRTTMTSPAPAAPTTTGSAIVQPTNPTNVPATPPAR
jgi:hypothetical protein